MCHRAGREREREAAGSECDSFPVGRERNPPFFLPHLFFFSLALSLSLSSFSSWQKRRTIAKVVCLYNCLVLQPSVRDTRFLNNPVSRLLSAIMLHRASHSIFSILPGRATETWLPSILFARLIFFFSLSLFLYDPYGIPHSATLIRSPSQVRALDNAIFFFLPFCHVGKTFP